MELRSKRSDCYGIVIIKIRCEFWSFLKHVILCCSEDILLFPNNACIC